jgi:hypothetical protein
MASQGFAAQGSVQPDARASVQVALAVVGSVCGTLITSALDTSPTVTLIGAVLGSAIPTLVTFAGRYHHLRAGVGIAVTVAALFITYGGFTMFDFATDRTHTFPLPPAGPKPASSAEAPQGGTPGAVLDEDGDGASSLVDCNDQDDSIHPDATDTPGDGIDQDCDGSDSEVEADGDRVDEDGDGASSSVDCNDQDDSIHPDATDTPGDGIDQDCDGSDGVP